jgi:hypothetical protein
MKRVLAPAIFAILVPALAFAQRGASRLDDIRTVPEKTDYRDTSKYADVMAFLEAIDKASDRVHLTKMGTTNEQRAIPLAVIGAPGASPQAVAGTGKLRVYIQGNIHGGEVEGKESAQMLLRDLAAGRHDDWLQSMVFLIAPIYNADGNERVSLTNRPSQHGPIGGMGQRPNAQGLDLNRDHMKLDSPEARSLVALMQNYDPHVAVDLHTTNGSIHAYQLTYAPPLNPATDPTIVDLLRNEWFPTLTRTIREKDGWDFYYYGNVSGRANDRTWATFDHRPRFNNNYVGLRNRFALLSEAYSYATFEQRIASTRRFVEEVLSFARQHAARLREITAQADARPLIGESLSLRAEPQRSAQKVEILMGEVTGEPNPFTGQMMNRRLDVRTPERMWEAGTFTSTLNERVPRAYLVPAELEAAIDRLTAHGIRTTRLTTDRRVKVERFRIQSNTQADQPFQNHRERTLTGAWEPAEQAVPAGTLVVSMNQPLARLAFYLLEPRSDDGLTNWNLLDEVLSGAATYPILKTDEDVR